MTVLTVGAAGAAGTFDYTCDGTADEVEIAAAIGAAGAGGTVALSAGTFHCSAAIDLLAGVSLVGAGAALTEIASTHNTLDAFLRAAGNNTIGDFTLAGHGSVAARGDNVTVARVDCTARIKPFAAFWASAVTGTIDNVLFEDCRALGTSGHGFFIDGLFAPLAADPVFSNITFRRCSAIGCGAARDLDYGTAWEWICGFLLEESCTTFTFENLAFEDCTATGCYKDGFHIEASTTIRPVSCTMDGCTSARNGIARLDAFEGYGFAVTPHFTLTDCTSTGDYAGVSVGTTYDGRTAPVRLTRVHVVDPVADGFYIGSPYYDGRLGNLIADGCSVSGCAAPNNYLYVWYCTDAKFLNFRVTDCTGAFEEGTFGSGTTIVYDPPFALSPVAPYAGQPIAFTDLSYGVSSWLWDFGDGSGSAAQHPTHTFAAPGRYVVTLAAGGNTVARTGMVREAVVYGGVELSEADLAPLDHDPVANATDLHNGRVGLQGSPVSRRTWTINALADDHAEIEALAALKGQHLTLNINGVEYPGVMIRPPMLETQLTPAAWAYQIGLVQETRR